MACPCPDPDTCRLCLGFGFRAYCITCLCHLDGDGCDCGAFPLPALADVIARAVAKHTHDWHRAHRVAADVIDALDAVDALPYLLDCADEVRCGEPGEYLEGVYVAFKHGVREHVADEIEALSEAHELRSVFDRLAAESEALSDAADRYLDEWKERGAA